MYEYLNHTIVIQFPVVYAAQRWFQELFAERAKLNNNHTIIPVARLKNLI